MSDLRNNTIDKAKTAYINAILDDLREPLRRVAAGLGYAICYHGSQARDLDIVAVPWTEQAVRDTALVADQITGAVRSVMGRAYLTNRDNPTQKPNGRIAYIIIHNDSLCEIDLSIAPVSDPTAYTLKGSVEVQLTPDVREVCRGALDLIDALSSESNLTPTPTQLSVIDSLTIIVGADSSNSSAV